MKASHRLWGRISAERRRKAIARIALLALAFLIIGLSIRFTRLQVFDLDVTRELQETSGAPWDQLMFLGTFLGSSLSVAVLAVVFAAVLWWRRLHRMAVFMLLTLISLPVDVLLKNLWNRPRPNADLIHVLLPASGSSFPSGHALCATTVYGFLAFLSWVHLPTRSGRFALSGFFAAIVPYVAISRVYVGAHWLSDVVGAFTIGLLLVVGLATFYHVDPVEAQKVAKIASTHT